jgi:NitT/TauT family transport system ATP-binding protein
MSGLENRGGGSIEGLERAAISYLFQENRLLPWLNIFDNMALVLKDKLPAGEIEKQIQHMLEILELSPSIDQLPSQLSGGMKHRAAIGRAFLYPASVLLLDEPFKELDEDLRNRLIGRIWPEYTKNKTVLLITHNREDVENLSDNQITL